MEWQYGYNTLSENARAQGIHLARLAKWYEQAVTTASLQRLFNDYRLPVSQPYDTEVVRLRALTQVATELIYGVASGKSLSNRRLVSAALAACALLPETARRVRSSGNAHGRRLRPVRSAEFPLSRQPAALREVQRGIVQVGSAGRGVSTAAHATRPFQARVAAGRERRTKTRRRWAIKTFPDATPRDQLGCTWVMLAAARIPCRRAVIQKTVIVEGRCSEAVVTPARTTASRRRDESPARAHFRRGVL